MVNDREGIVKRRADLQPPKKDEVDKSKAKDDKIKSESFVNFAKRDLDLTYVNKILSELRHNTHNYAERPEIMEEYKKLTMFCVRNLEQGSRLGKADPDRKATIVREVNRVFNERFEKAEEFKDYVQRMVHYRLEDLKREVKDNKWKIYLTFLTEFLRQNPKNRDLLEKLKFKVAWSYKKIPDDLRHIIWRAALGNPKEEKEYSSLLRTDKALTVSKFEMNILNETRTFVSKFVSESLFDTGMVQCMKTILSYVEKKTDVILSDYQYLLCIPLIVAFSELRWLISSPTELVGHYFSLVDLVKFFDKNAGLKAAIDDAKEFEIVAETIDAVERFDEQLAQKLRTYAADEGYRKSLT